MEKEPLSIRVFPATPDRWLDLEKLFGSHGASSGCWCMFWRIKRVEFNRTSREGKKELLKGMVDSNKVPGLLAYVGSEAAGWCCVGPREDFPPLEKSRTLKSAEDASGTWSIVCFFVARSYRHKGVMTTLVKEAVRYAAEHGARVVEAYPTNMQAENLAGKKLTGYSGYMGISTVLSELGFEKVSDASPTQLIMRYQIPG